MSIDHATRLQALQLNGMATAWRELQAEKPRQAHRPESWMERLIVAEQTERQLKSLRYQLKAARFPIHRDLLGIDWAETPLSQAVVEQLASAAFYGNRAQPDSGRRHRYRYLYRKVSSGHCHRASSDPSRQTGTFLQCG